MIPPEGDTKAANGQVYKLIKSLYKELSTRLKNFGFRKSEIDHCLFVKDFKNFRTPGLY